MKNLIALAALVSASASFAQAEEFVFDVSAYELAGLQANVLHGGVTVRGYDGDQIQVTVDFGEDDPAPRSQMNNEGVWVLPNLGRDLNVFQDGDTVVIRAGSEGRAAQVAVQVPRNTNLMLTVRQDGDIRVSGVAGEMELQNSSGRIQLEDVVNTVVAHAQSDSIMASYATASPPGPASFSSWSGNVELHLPDDFGATLRWRSNYGQILSDFEVEDIRSVSTRAETGERGQIEGYTVGRINEGGPELTATSYSGDVSFRKRTR